MANRASTGLKGDYAEYDKKNLPAPPFDRKELTDLSFYKDIMTVGTLVFLYVTAATLIGYDSIPLCLGGMGGMGVLGISLCLGGMTFVVLYCTPAGRHVNPGVTFGRAVGRKMTLNRALLYMVSQSVGAVCGTGLVKALQKNYYSTGGGGDNTVCPGYTKGTALAAEIIAAFIVVYTVFTANDRKARLRDSSVPVLAPLAIGFSVCMVHLPTIPINGAGINPARSFGAAAIYGNKMSWHNDWIYWVGPLMGGAIAGAYHEYILPLFDATGSIRPSSAPEGHEIA